MKVEVTEKKLSSDGFIASEGDRLTVPDEVGQSWCKNGWAKDLDGVCPTGERNINPVSINPKKIVSNPIAKQVK